MIRLFTFLLSVLYAISSHADLIEPPLYQAVRAISLKLKARYDFRRTTFVMLGRSPAPVAAFLEELGADVYFLPLSDLRRSNFRRPTMNRYAGFLGPVVPFKTRPGQLAYLDCHLDTFLPDAAFQGKDALVLVDYVVFGTSLRRARALLRDYLSRRSRNLRLETFPFTSVTAPAASFWMLANSLRTEGFHIFWEHFGPASTAFLLQTVKRFAPYPKFDIREVQTYQAPIRDDTKYMQLRTFIREQMDRERCAATLD